MKFNTYHVRRKRFFQFLLAMKLTLVLLIVGLLQVNAASFAQKITISKENAPLKQVFTEIQEQSGYHFLYTNEMLGEASRVNIRLRGASLKEALRQCFAGQPLTYTIKKKTVIVKRQRRSFSGFAVERDLLQTDTLRGTVTDTMGVPLPGVSVIVKSEPGLGTSTGTNGTFVLKAPADAVLIFSYLGYKTQEIPVNGRPVINTMLREEGALLDELVVVGYGTQKKSDLTGAVSSVGAEELTRYPATTAVQALQGRAAGVIVQSINGSPGGEFKIRVRGATSINASSNPLIVVNGLIGGSMPPPEDIASIEVLKDASASAIYGSRGANGVVMITTKSGKAGKLEVKLNSYFSTQKEIGRLEVLNADEFAEYVNDARGYEFFDLNSVTVDTDWQDLIFQPGYTQNHQLSVSGGSGKAQYYVSGIFRDQVGVIKTSGFDRYSLTTNLKFDLSDHVRLNLNTLLRNLHSNDVVSQSGGGVLNSGPVTSAQRFDPNQGILDENGAYTKSVVGIAAYENPMASIDGRDAEFNRDEIQINLKAEFDIAKGLVLNSRFGTVIRNTRNGSYANRISNLGEGYNGRATMGYGKNFNFLTEQYLNYTFNAAEVHNFVLTGGYSYQLFQNESFSASNANFITDALGFWNLEGGTNLQIPSSGYSGTKIASFYGRLNYNFDNRYLVTFSSRYDGASQFSDGNKWSFFPSGALSWNIHNEAFWLKNNAFSSLKLRLSYGLTGNQAIGAYQSLARISNSFFVLNSNSVAAVRPTSIANKDLTWETTAQSNVGLDVGLFNGRIHLSSNYYYKKTEDLLFNVPIPAFSGYQRRLENLGSIENKGFEFQLASRNLVNELKWTTSFNISLNRNKVLKLPGGVDVFYSTAPASNGGVMQTSLLREGEPVGVFYGFIYEGVYQEGDTFIPGGGFETTPGGEKFADLNEDGILDNNDRTIIGDPNPKAVWGFNNDLSYKGFYLNLFFQAYTGGDMMNLVKLDLDRLSGNGNATRDALNRWTPESTDTDIPKAAAGRASRVSTRFVEDGSFVRLKNISIGYDFNPTWLSKWRISSARIYMSGQNLLTFTDYSGVDPEVAYRSSNVNMGLDFDSYPNTISYTFGLTLGF